MLHVFNGDSAAGLLRAAKLPGEVVVWADVLHDGPILTGGSRDAYRAARAAFLASTGAGDVDDILTQLMQWDTGLAAIHTHDELVMWFEHDLYDQLILAHHLHFLSQHDALRTKLTLVCIGDHPRIERFCGLGQLAADDMPALFDARQPVTDAQLALGARAWEAVGGDDAQAIERICDGDTAALPFLAPALRRWLAEYPSVTDGLGATPRQILRAVAHGPATGTAVFKAHQAAEAAPFLGDTMLFHEVRRLASAKHPLVTVDATFASRPAHGNVSMTETGRRVLAGKADAIALNGIDRWFGGVHLTGTRPRWRWDDGRGRLVVVR